jgi:hypothetical protein
MPVDMKRYPKDWNAISRRIKEREGWKCKFCGVRHGAWGWREANGDFVEAKIGPLKDAGFDRPPFTIACSDGRSRKIVEIILTVAHLGEAKVDGSPGDKHDKFDCRDENLAALCQRCHLRYDIAEHVENASKTRARKRVESGNVALPLGES